MLGEEVACSCHSPPAAGFVLDGCSGPPRWPPLATAGTLQALLQRIHQVDHLGVSCRLDLRAHRHTLALLLDQGAERVLIPVLEFTRVEVAGLLLNNLL